MQGQPENGVILKFIASLMERRRLADIFAISKALLNSIWRRAVAAPLWQPEKGLVLCGWRWA